VIGPTLSMALKQLLRNRVRTALTSLGILIGVAAVIAMVSIGQAATAAVEGDLSELGDNILFVAPGNPQGPPRPSPAFGALDVEAIEQLPHIASVAPTNSTMARVSNGENSRTAMIFGVTQEYFTVMQRAIVSGRPFDEGELLSGTDVCVVGKTVIDELFGAQDPLDHTVRVGTSACRVVGAVEEKGTNTFGQDQDDFVLLPLPAYQRRVAGNNDVGMILIAAEDSRYTPRVKADLQALMRQRRHIPEGASDDFVVRDMASLAEMLGNISAILTGFLASIAAVSLLVGGIGIMNIMLVSVTERTREIGIRLAVGALGRDVLLQFLVEAVVLSALGGVLGIALGVLGSWGASKALDVPFVVDPGVVGGAFLFSALLGVIFGYFPARRAARMRPIDALRHTG
jgi:putative ABC transport system permease protein